MACSLFCMNFGLFFRSVGPSVPSILHVSFGRISLFSVGCQTCLLSPKSPFLSPRFSVQMFCRPNLLSPNRRVDCAVAKPTFQIAVFRALFAVSQFSVKLFKFPLKGPKAECSLFSTGVDTLSHSLASNRFFVNFR